MCIRNYKMLDRAYIEPLNCIIPFGERIIAGAVDGKLYIIKNTTLQVYINKFNIESSIIKCKINIIIIN